MKRYKTRNKQNLTSPNGKIAKLEIISDKINQKQNIKISPKLLTKIKPLHFLESQQTPTKISSVIENDTKASNSNKKSLITEMKNILKQNVTTYNHNPKARNNLENQKLDELKENSSNEISKTINSTSHTSLITRDNAKEKNIKKNHPKANSHSFSEILPTKKIELELEKRHNTFQKSPVSCNTFDFINGQQSANNVSQHHSNLSSSTKVLQKESPTIINDHNSSINVNSDESNGFFGLPTSVERLLLLHSSINNLYDWQVECLKMEMQNDGCNLICSLPTSGGKTLVAQILMLKQVLVKKKSVIFVVPFVALVHEKMESLSDICNDLNIDTLAYAQNKGRIPPLNSKQACIYIGTIEKVDMLIASLIQEGRIQEIGLLVVDELHMLGDGTRRGGVLESLIVKITTANKSIQVVGMSATLNNIDTIKKFLNAQLFTSLFRPVHLKEHVKVNNEIYTVRQSSKDEDFITFERQLTFKDYTDSMKKLDPDGLYALVTHNNHNKNNNNNNSDTRSNDNNNNNNNKIGNINNEIAQTLLFCHSKKNCENVALLMAQLFTLNNWRTDADVSQRHILVQNLVSEGAGFVCPILKRCVMEGVAYHHGGLTSGERSLIEEGYRRGVVSVLCCTSTLAAGVNLPALRVIIRTPMIGCKMMTHSQYRQMIGRAGRAGFQSQGESFLLVDNKNKLMVKDVIQGRYDDCKSSLLHDGGLENFVLSCVALELVRNVGDLRDIIKKTLFYIQHVHHCNDNNNNNDLLLKMKEVIHALVDGGFIIEFNNNKKNNNNNNNTNLPLETPLKVTKLGQATFKGNIALKHANATYRLLQKHRGQLNLSNYLHLLFIAIPYDALKELTNVDWVCYLKQMAKVDEEGVRLMQQLCVKEVYVCRRSQGLSSHAMEEDTAKRFFLTLMMDQIFKQQNIFQIAAKFNVSRAFVQHLLQSTCSNAYNLINFSQEIDDMWSYRELLPSFLNQLSHSASPLLHVLMEATHLKIGRARMLYNMGFKTPQQLAATSASEITSKSPFIPFKVAKMAIHCAQMYLKQKMEELLGEAELYKFK